MPKTSFLLATLFAPLSTVLAGEADVVNADVDCDAGSCRFAVTLSHADAGWDHYADKWEILDADGRVLGVRELAHPHVTEQPFTRSLGDVDIPDGVDEVVIRAHDSVHGYGGKELTVAIPKR